MILLENIHDSRCYRVNPLRLPARLNAQLLRSYSYDKYYHLNRLSGPEHNPFIFVNDANGNRINRSVLGVPGTTIYHYDGQNRLQSIDYPDDQGYSFDVNYEYDHNNNLIEATTDPNNPTQFSYFQWIYRYDANDLRYQETLTASGSSYITTYGYTAIDHLETITYPSGQLINYSPNDLGWPTGVSGYASNVQYHPNGATKAIPFANGQTLNVTLNNRQWVESLITTSVATGIDLTYGYDEVGNVTQLINPADPELSPLTPGYDGVDRLISTQGDALGPDAPAGFDFYGWDLIYDTRDNLISTTAAYRSTASGVDKVVLQLGNSDYDANNRFVTANFSFRTHSQDGVVLDTAWSSSSYPLEYDARGNIILDGGWRYAYNHAGELRSVYGKSITGAPPTDTSLWSYGYAYDANGNRVAKTRISDGRSHLYVKGQAGLLVDDDSLQGRKEMIYLNGQLIAERHANGVKTFFYNDALGSPQVAADSSGSLIWRQNYILYGTRQDIQPVYDLETYPLQYTGQPLDNETNLQYFGARYYSPSFGRFYAIDPVGFTADNIHSFNRYAYANNNPFRFVDPTGLEPFTQSDIDDALSKLREHEEYIKIEGYAQPNIKLDASVEDAKYFSEANTIVINPQLGNIQYLCTRQKKISI